MSSFGNNFFSIKSNYCCLRNTLSYCLIPNFSLKISAFVFTALIVIFTAKVFSINILQGSMFTTLLYFAPDFFKFVRIILSSVRNICDIKFFLKMSSIYPYFTSILYYFNTIFSPYSCSD